MQLILGDLKLLCWEQPRKKQKSFNQLQLLTNDELYMDSETGVVTITNSGTMNTDKELTKGTKMISDLITNDEYNCKITRDYIEK